MTASHVLVPLDGSPLAEEALVEALELFDCRVTVLNVVTPVDTSMSESGVLDSDGERRESAHDRAERVIERVREQTTDPAEPVDTAVETGDPAETILAYIDDHDIDHVVMGGHGQERADIVNRLLGTVATKIVSEAPVTVTVVR